MKINIDFSEILDLKEELEKYPEMLSQVMEKTTLKGASAIVSTAQKHTPVRTGILRNGWEITSDKVLRQGKTYSLDIRNDVEYAPYVNYGHRLKNGNFLAGVHMLEKGEAMAKKNIEYYFLDELKKLVMNVTVGG